MNDQWNQPEPTSEFDTDMDEVAAALRTHASRQSTPDLAAGAFARARVIRRRRLTMAAGAVAVVLAGATVGAVQVLRPDPQVQVATASPSVSSSSPSLSSSPSQTPSRAAPTTPSPSRTTSAPSAPTSPATRGGSATSGTSATSSAVVPPPPVNVPECAPASVSLTLTVDNAGAGHVYHRLTVTNTGPAACRLVGYPGVSLVDASGAQIGAAADRTPAAKPALTLARGQAATAWLDVTQAANYGCTVTPSAGVRVYLPGRKDSSVVPRTFSGCRETTIVLLHVKPFGAN